jgi:hypothetical protein
MIRKVYSGVAAWASREDWLESNVAVNRTMAVSSARVEGILIGIPAILYGDPSP